MKQDYDFIFLTNTPSFYKLNLCNEVAKKCKLLLVFLGYTSEAVNVEISNDKKWRFDSHFLHCGDLTKRSKLIVLFRLVKLLRSVSYKYILFSGWYMPEYIIMLFLSRKSKNVMICESTIKESHANGLSGLIKKVILNRTSFALPSGSLHHELIKALGYKGKIITTGGVGIFNKEFTPSLHKSDIKYFNYLYVGRLIEIKNLRFLISIFNNSGKPLTIVGNGKLENELKSMAKGNITFAGFVENEKLPDIYRNHQIFILPSRSEPWGLVVDEALYHGLPVIVSNMVGCSIDLVEKTRTGEIFILDNPLSFNKAIESVETDYYKYVENVKKLDFNQRDHLQVKAYLNLIIKEKL